MSNKSKNSHSRSAALAASDVGRCLYRMARKRGGKIAYFFVCIYVLNRGFYLRKFQKLVLVYAGTLKMRDMKLRDMKMRHHVAGVENARHEFAAPDCRGGKCET